MSTPIAFVRVDTAHGIAWMKQAFGMFRRAPLAWLLLIFTYYFLVAITELGPWAYVGQIVAPIMKPVFAVGFLAAAWTQERGDAPRFEHLFRGFRSNLFALIPLGIVFLVGMTLAIWATTLVDGGVLVGALATGERPAPDAPASGRLLFAMLFGAVCALPTLFALWFAPALVVFNDASAARALATSLRASLANWRPLLMFALALFGLGVLLPGMVVTIARLFGDTLAGVVALFVIVPYFFVFIATLHISDYVSYRDVFRPDEPPLAAPPVGSSQS
ncbi:MAG: BPSS1780 family membrane protein [Casimicrobiaceae bacterium]